MIVSKTAHTILIFVGLTVAPHLIPALAPYRVPLPVPRRPVAHAAGAMAVQPDAPPAPVARTGAAARPDATASPVPGTMEDPSGIALSGLFAALRRTETEGGRTRISHYGDSPITNDGITSTLRRKLQSRFGDAGHGFILIDRPWGWYEHVGVSRKASKGWTSDPIHITAKGERYYGFGGVSFTASAAGVTATFKATPESDAPHEVAAFDIDFLARPRGGDFDVEIDGKTIQRVSTNAETIRSAFYRAEAPDRSNSHPVLTLRVVGNGPVQLFGVSLEAETGGVQYDSLGVNGAHIALLSRYLDTDHWTEQLRHRAPDLVIIGYGANESQFEALPMDQYEKDTRAVIRRIKAALPDASILLLGPMDRGMRGPGGETVTRPMIPKLIAYQRRLAFEEGCAFFDTFTAMGGEGTVARWMEAHPKLMGGDFTHPTFQGSEIVGSLIYDALMKAYQDKQ